MIGKQKITVSALLKKLPLATIVATSLVLSVIVVIGLWTYSIQITQVERADLNRLSEQQANDQARAIDLYLNKQVAQLTRFAVRESTVRAIEKKNGALKAVVRTIKSAFPDAHYIRAFTLDRTEITPKASLSFLEMDMLNRAEANDEVHPEIVTIDKRRFFVMAASVRAAANEEPQGTLLVAIPATAMFKLTSSANADFGELRIQLATKNNSILLYKTGVGDAGESASAKVGKSQWRVEFTPAQILADKTARSGLLIILLYTSVALLLAGLCIKLGKQYDPALRGNKPLCASALAGKDLRDIELSSEDKDLLGLAETTQTHQKIVPIKVETPSAAQAHSQDLSYSLPNSIFRAYDIRGIAGTEISFKVAKLLGQAVGSEALASGETSIFVARDGRTTSSALSERLIRGILSTGCNVTNLGPAPSPLLYYAISTSTDCNSGVVVTASHNPAEYNGFKVVINGKALAGAAILKLKSRIINDEIVAGNGQEQNRNIDDDYIERIFSDVALASDIKIVVDAGNGITGEIAPKLLQELGCEVVPLYCDIDGTFPNHDPDPTIASHLRDLIAEVKNSGANLGVAFDGDGDRLVVVTPHGKIISPDQLLMLFAKDIVSRHPGADVVFDVKCTRELNNLVRNYGGRPIMWKTGHSHMKAKMQATGAILGGELSGHIYIKDRWYGFDDGMYACVRLLEIMTLRDQELDELFECFPMLPATPELKVEVPEERKFEIIDALIKKGVFPEGKITAIDGLRVDFLKGWGLVRASNTSPTLTLRFEAETKAILTELQKLFKQELLKVNSSLKLPF